MQQMKRKSGKRSIWGKIVAGAASVAVATAGLISGMPTAPAEAKLEAEQDAIAVLFSYPWNDIAEQCETTLGPAGYGYVQTSPPQEHIQGEAWWTYYQPVSYDLNSRLGTEAEFQDMIDRCDDAGVGVIADVVVNHMSGQPDGGTGFAGTEFEYENYPGLYDPSDFNSYKGEGGPEEPCSENIEDYTNRWEVQTCRLVGLSDLNTSKPEVQDKIAGYMNELADMGVAGFRVDAVKHIPATDMEEIWGKVKNNDDLYMVQEVIRGGGEPIGPEEYANIGDVHEFEYATQIRTAFQSNQVGDLLSKGGIGIGSDWDMLNSDQAAVFVDNHDTERNGQTLSYKDGRTYDLAQAFTLAWNYSSPSIHSGYAFTDYDAGPAQDADGKVLSPSKENGWTFKHSQNNIANMVGFHNEVAGQDVNNQWTDEGNNAIAFGRGTTGFFAMNNGAAALDVQLETSLPDGVYYNIFAAAHNNEDDTWSGPTVTVKDGKIATSIDGQSAIALTTDATTDTECTETSAPTQPTGLTGTATYSSVKLTWNESTNTCGGITYEIERTNTATGESDTLTAASGQLTDKNLPESTEFTYTVTAKDKAGQSSATTDPFTITTAKKPEGTYTTVYLKAPDSWNNANFHYSTTGDSGWTPVPGVEMAPYDEVPGWFVVDVLTDDATQIEANFNTNSGGEWLSKGSGKNGNYLIPAGDGPQMVNGSKVTAGTPSSEDTDPGTDESRYAVGSFQKALGCGDDWAADCEETALTYNSDYELWLGEFDIAARDHELKITDGTWDNSWGTPAGDNIAFTATADPTHIIHSPATHETVAAPQSELYTVAGDWQGAVGCGTWEENCLGSVMFPQDDGTYRLTTSNIPAGNYGAKVVKGFNWDTSWGDNGGNVTFSTNEGENVTFIFDPATKQVSVEVSNPPLAGTGESRAYWIGPDTIAWPTSLGGSEFVLVGNDDDVTLTPDDLTDEQKAAFPRVKSGYTALRVSTDGDLDETVREILKGSVQIEATEDGETVAQTGAQIAGVVDALYPGAAERDLGLTWDGDTPTLSVWAPTATEVTLQLEDQEIAAERDEDGVWTVVGEPSWKGAGYLWNVDVFVPSQGEVVTNQVTDPYSVALTTDSKQSVIADLTDPELYPEEWNNSPDAPATPAAETIYELHVRDFSIADETVPEDLRGTYKAFTQSNSDGVKHLTELSDAGMTTVHLLPTFDIASSSIPESRENQLVPEIGGGDPSSKNQQAAVAAVQDEDGFNWGYDPYHWSTPEGSYATNGHQDGAARTREYRDMVSALHGMGLRVVTDQVFNHTSASGQADEAVLDRIVPGYYHRLDAKGAIETSTCCQNIATENVMAGKMMVDSVELWATQYGVDGFRFDLMGHHTLQNMVDIREMLDGLTLEKDGVNGKEIYLYGEGWDFGEVEGDALFKQATQANIGGTGIGAFNDRLRDAVRGGGPFDSDQRTYQGFGSGLYTYPNEVAAETVPEDEQLASLLHQTDLVRIGLAGNVKGVQIPAGDGEFVNSEEIDYNGVPAAYALDPDENVNYVDAHDNETLFDNLVWKLPTDATMDTQIRMNTLSLATATLGQSPSFWHAGTDMLRSKSLDRDSYNSGDHFNAIDWTMQTNGYANGLPMKGVNGEKWPLMKPLLENASKVPAPEDIKAANEMSLDLLKVRSSSPLFSLGSGELVKERVSFTNGGAGATPGLLVMQIDDAAPGVMGKALEANADLDVTFKQDIDPDVDRLVVVFNASAGEITEELDGLSGHDLELSPVQANGFDEVVKETAWDSKTGTLTIPARTVAVLVEPAAGTEPGPDPTDPPTTDPTEEPTGEPTDGPTTGPSGEPTDGTTDQPTTGPSNGGTDQPGDGATGGATAGAANPGDDLANSGANVLAFAGLAVLLLAAGGLALYGRRNRAS